MATTTKLCRIAKHHRCTVAPFLTHSDPNSIFESEQPGHKQLKLRFKNYGVPVATTQVPFDSVFICKKLNTNDITNIIVIT